MRILFLFAASLLLATFSPLVEQAPEKVPAVMLLEFSKVPLDRSYPGRIRLGGLSFLGGWSIASNDYRFGGISAMHVEGDHALALSDTGTLTRFALPGSRAVPRIMVIPEGPGSAKAKSNRDSESLAVAGQLVWIGYERSNAVWRYDRANWHATASARPAGMRKWRANRGTEALVRLSDGRFLAFSEGGGGASAVLLFDGDPTLAGTKSMRLTYHPPRGYRITDAALLPDGRLLFLNRRFAILEGVSAKLTLGTLPKLQEGAELSGVEIADFRNPVTVDNMEALSVAVEDGRPIVWIASDDNFSPLQRTLLLKFALKDY